MMKQYLQIKEQNQDAILFFRLGDFYEMFGDDARKASKELDLTLTTRDKDKNKSFEEKIPMCGIPYHASDAYIARLIAKGYKVAICEQTEDPATAKGLVDRDIIRVVTPGTVIDAACLEEGTLQLLRGAVSGRHLRGLQRVRHLHRQDPRHRLPGSGPGGAPAQRAGAVFPGGGGGEPGGLRLRAAAESDAG